MAGANSPFQASVLSLPAAVDTILFGSNNLLRLGAESNDLRVGSSTSGYRTVNALDFKFSGTGDALSTQLNAKAALAGASFTGNASVSGTLTADLSGDVPGVSSTVNSVTGHRVSIGSTTGSDNCSVTLGMPSHIVIPAGQAFAGANISNLFVGTGRKDLFHSYVPITFFEDGTMTLGARASKSISFTHAGPISYTHIDGNTANESNRMVNDKAGELSAEALWKFYTRMYRYSTLSNVSDDRLKINERPITDALQTLRKLAPQRYTRVSKEGDTTGFEEAGLIAQHIDAIPELKFAVSRPGNETTTDPITGETRTKRAGPPEKINRAGPTDVFGTPKAQGKVYKDLQGHAGGLKFTCRKVDIRGMLKSGFFLREDSTFFQTPSFGCPWS